MLKSSHCDVSAMPVKLRQQAPQEAVSLAHLPAPPMAMHTILRAASDPTVSLTELSKLVSSEPSFTVELLRVANSAFYARKEPIVGATRATVALGARAVRNLAVGHVLRVAAENLDVGELDLNQFWEDSVRKSAIAQVLGEMAGCEDPEDCATIGLIQDGGILIMAATWPQFTRQLQHHSRKPGAQRIHLERQLCDINHAELFGHVSSRWGLPADIVDAIAGHHNPEARGGTRRANRLLEIARVTDSISDVFAAPHNGDAIKIAVASLRKLPSRQEIPLSEVISIVEQRAPAIARDQRVNYREAQPISELIAEAVAAMVQIAHQYEHATLELEQRLEERQQMTRRLEHSNSQLTRLATTDALTGISNRRYFTEVLKHTIDDGARSKRPTSLLMFDLDHFKNVNDSHGHAAGDDVLRLVAERVGRVLRPSDLLGRLGGEEFAIVLPDTNERSGQSVTERARLAVSREPIRTRGGVLIPVTASFGGITARGRASADRMLGLVDEAMYASKGAGRNAISWTKL